MDIKDILSVGLTAEDFDLLLCGLDAIPERESSSLLNLELMKIMLAPTKIHAEQSMEKMEKRAGELKKNQESKKEDFIVLKSKLILLKRLLVSNEAVKMAIDILHSTPPTHSND